MKEYYIQLDSNGYIIDITSMGPLLDGYIKILTNEQIPDLIMRGYYRWSNGFILDFDKKTEVDKRIIANPSIIK